MLKKDIWKKWIVFSSLFVLVGIGVWAFYFRASNTPTCDQVILTMKGEEGDAPEMDHSQHGQDHPPSHQMSEIPFNERFAESNEMLVRMKSAKWSCLKIALVSEEHGIQQMATVHLSQEKRVGAKAIEKWFDDSDPKVRSGVAYVIGRTKEKRFLEILFLLLRDETPEVRQAAVLAIRYFRLTPARRSEWVEPLLEDSDPRVRGEAAATLGYTESLSSSPKLVRRLSDENSDVVVRSIYALKNLYAVKSTDDTVKKDIRNRASDSLIKLLSKPDKRVQKAAIMALGKFRIQKALDPIMERLDTLDSDQLPTAFSALEEITSEDIEPRVDAWNAWWRKNAR